MGMKLIKQIQIIQFDNYIHKKTVTCNLIKILEAPREVKYISYLSDTLHGHARDDEFLRQNESSAHTEDEDHAS